MSYFEDSAPAMRASSVLLSDLDPLITLLSSVFSFVLFNPRSPYLKYPVVYGEVLLRE